MALNSLPITAQKSYLIYKEFFENLYFELDNENISKDIKIMFGKKHEFSWFLFKYGDFRFPLRGKPSKNKIYEKNVYEKLLENRNLSSFSLNILRKHINDSDIGFFEDEEKRTYLKGFTENIPEFNNIFINVGQEIFYVRLPDKNYYALTTHPIIKFPMIGDRLTIKRNDIEILNLIVEFSMEPNVTSGLIIVSREF